jgi:hypothetical protein
MYFTLGLQGGQPGFLLGFRLVIDVNRKDRDQANYKLPISGKYGFNALAMQGE